MNHHAIWVVAAAGVLSSNPAVAQYVEAAPPGPVEQGAPLPEEEGPPGQECAPPLDPTLDRHLGFFFRAELGFGFMSTSASMPVEGGITRAFIEGPTVTIGVSAGLSIVENLSLAAEAWMTSAYSPIFGSAGQSVRVDDATVDLFGMGLQVSYYLAPANLYLSVTPSLSTLSTSEANVSTATKEGFGLKIAVGKEWWIGRHWGMGVSGQFYFGSNLDAGTPGVTWTTLGGAVALSATYN
jgi:hypothetical protein